LYGNWDLISFSEYAREKGDTPISGVKRAIVSVVVMDLNGSTAGQP